MLGTIALTLVFAGSGHSEQYHRIVLACVTSAGRELANSLDRLDVEHRWVCSTKHIAWRTGLPLLEEHGEHLLPFAKDETHCSAFAAAAADSLAIYLLRPPDHSHILLSNAQFDWLAGGSGRQAGWVPISTPLEAQNLANQGQLVVAIAKGQTAHRPGHVAIVRPALVGATRLEECGPQIIQAGVENFRSMDLKTGFAHHPDAWLPGGAGSVRFFVHNVRFDRGVTPPVADGEVCQRSAEVVFRLPNLQCQVVRGRAETLLSALWR